MIGEDMLLDISIHALLAESDRVESGQRHLPRNFYPRSPCGERPRNFIICLSFFVFLSTLSLRRATSSVNTADKEARISIHALLAESDPGPKVMTPDKYYFYPRSPCGERRNFITNELLTALFLSTLSLRRATTANRTDPSAILDFYPRSPCGERHR